RKNNKWTGKILDRSRERRFTDDADLVLVELVDPVDPLDVLLVDGPVFGPRDVGQRIDHVVGVERGAVVKLDTLAQLQFECLVIDPLPGGRKLPAIFSGPGITIDQCVPDLEPK